VLAASALPQRLDRLLQTTLRRPRVRAAVSGEDRALERGVVDERVIAKSLRASNKTLIPDVETTSGQSLNGIRAVRFLDQGEPGVEIVELAMPYAGKFMRRSRSWKRASERRLSHLGSTPK